MSEELRRGADLGEADFAALEEVLHGVTAMVYMGASL